MYESFCIATPALAGQTGSLIIITAHNLWEEVWIRSMLVEWFEGGNGLNFPPGTPDPPLNVFQLEDITKVNQSKQHKKGDINPSSSNLFHLLDGIPQPKIGSKLKIRIKIRNIIWIKIWIKIQIKR